MTDRPSVIDVDWQEDLPLLERTGFFTEEDLQDPDAAARKLADLVRRHTTAIGYVDEKGEMNPTGSGTFVRRADGQWGVMTAGHVLRRAIRCGNGFHVFPGQIGELPWIRIPGDLDLMRVHGETNEGAAGPDIGWVPMSAETAGTLEARGVVFYNMARTRKMEAERGAVGSIVVGFVKEMSDPENRMLGFHGMLLGRTGKRSTDDGWDYSEYALTMPSLPRSHGGTSGSAVWRVELALDGSGGSVAFLDGVVFAEGGSDDRKLISHGERSVSRILGKA